MGFGQYGDFDALGLADLVRRREVAAEELLEEALERTARVNPRINAVIHLMADRARAAVAAGLPDGPLRGVPFLLKDLLAGYAGEPMRCGSRLYRDAVPTQDEELVRRFARAGLVVFGKTNTPEYGLSVVTEPELFGPTRNPWDLERTPGGSSGGSAAAVAARIVPIASAGDGGGSIRAPASCTGLVGLKPSRGRNPSGPGEPEHWWGFVCEHVVSRTVRDSAAVLDATAGDYPAQLMKLAPPAGRFLAAVGCEPGRLRIAVSVGPGLGGGLHPECREAVLATAARLESLGHQIEAVDLPVDRDGFIQAYSLLLAADTAVTVRQGARARGRAATADDVEPATWVLNRLGEAISGADVNEAIWWMQQFARRWLLWAEPYDVLVTSTLGRPPERLGFMTPSEEVRATLRQLDAAPSSYLAEHRAAVIEAFRPAFDYSSQTMMANVSGQPSLSLPLAWSGDGLPIGVMFTARVGDEATLLSLASQLEAAFPWAARVPRVNANP